MQVRPFTWLTLSFFGYYCAYGVFLPLFPAWLKTQSYSEESIGLLLACGYIFRFSGSILFSGLIVSHISRRVLEHTLHNQLYILPITRIFA